MGALPKDVTIIGAGLAGTALALALTQNHIPVQIYESRSPTAPELASGVVLTPNGLRVLDAIGVFARITDHCWKAEYRTYINDKDETTRKILVADETLYGYKNHRLWRRLLLAEMKRMLEEAGVRISYQSRFEEVVSEGGEGVKFRVNGEEKLTSMLVGTDGIFSSVRRYLDPEIQPEYTGTVGALAHIWRDSVKWPYPDYEPQFTMQGKPGAFFTMPEDPEAKEIMVGMQVQRSEETRAEWDALAADKDKLCELFRRGYNDWNDTAKSIIDQVCKAKESIYLWPFLRMPKLEKWYSKNGKVLILGDAAHAIPPSSGQGVNQALEDVYSLILLLKRSDDLAKSLEMWQNMRQKRVDMVFDWATKSTNVQRMPEAERQKFVAKGNTCDPNVNSDDMRWLYQLDLDKEVTDMLR